MSDTFVPSDVAIIDLLRKQEGLSIAQLAAAMGVTATAVRQRLNRLLAQGHVARTAEGYGRGRPRHVYRLTEKGRRKSGANFADLAIALWEEIRQIKDLEVRRGLIMRLSRRLAELYADRIEGETLQEKMRAVSELFNERRIPFTVEGDSRLPVLTAVACPYPELAEKDRGICSMERLMFSEMLGEDVKLTHCRLDGDTSCCTFQPAESIAHT